MDLFCIGQEFRSIRRCVDGSDSGDAGRRRCKVVENRREVTIYVLNGVEAVEGIVDGDGDEADRRKG